MSGVHGLNWLPTGPGVLKHILRWLRFPHGLCTYWLEEAGQKQNLGRVEVLAARVQDPLARLSRSRPDVGSPTRASGP
jgi:hypothetical protein